MSRVDKVFWWVMVLAFVASGIYGLHIVVTAAWWTGRCSVTICPDGSRGLAIGEQCVCRVPPKDQTP